MGLFSGITNIAAPFLNPLSAIGGLGGLTGEHGYEQAADQYAAGAAHLQELYDPFIQGTALEGFQGSPGFQFQLDQGLKGVERMMSARGMSSSGNELLELQRVGQGMAMQDYENEWRRRLGALQGFTGGYTNLLGGRAGMTGQAGAATSGFLQDIIGMGAGMFAMSDRDLKENLVHQYDLVPNVGIYEFNYKGSPEKHIGVIAQEVEQVLPQAVTMKNGYRAVNYGLLYSVLD